MKVAHNLETIFKIVVFINMKLAKNVDMITKIVVFVLEVKISIFCVMAAVLKK